MINYSHKFAMKINRKMLPYEVKYNLVLNPEKYYIIRFDGVKMTKNFLGKPEKVDIFLKTMYDSIQGFMINNPNLKFAYSYSDEISILLSKEVLKEFAYRIEKILSIYSSQLGFIFAVKAKENGLNMEDQIRCFDCRIIELKNFDLVYEYFISRQVFQISSHFLRLKYQHTPTLNSTNTNDIYDALLKKGINYDKFSKQEKYGIIWVGQDFLEPYEFMTNSKKLQEQLLLNPKFIYSKHRK